MKCTKRKEILKQKRKEETEQTKLTYAGVTLTQPQSVISHANMYGPPTITREDTLLINICVSHAHYVNASNPGSYEEELNRILTANKLPNVKIPSTPDSRKILSTIANPQAHKHKHTNRHKHSRL